MKPSTRNLLIGAIAIVAVALAAATLESTVVPEPGGSSGPGFIGAEGEGGLLPIPKSRPPPGFAFDIPFLVEIFMIAAVIAIVISIIGMFFYWRETLQMLGALAALFALIYLLFELLGSGTLPEPTAAGVGNGSFLGGGGGGAEVETSQPSPPSVVLLLILGLAIVGVAVGLFRARGTGASDTEEDAEEPTPEPAAVGRAAGRAADRLEQETQVDNEIYRAWREMTALLDIDEPESTTPGEFASAAVDAGLGQDDVEELTRLFEDVRYGRTEPSSELEGRAITVFRRIENRYTEDE